MSRIIPSLSKMWHKIINLENTLFPALQESLQLEAFSHKEQKLIRILDFAQIEENVTVVNITNPPKDREEIARAFIAKSVYNIQTTRDLIERLHIDRTLRILCGWRYKNDIPSESKFSRVFKELSKQAVAQKTHEKFIATYLKEKIFFYNATDATKIPLREKVVKEEEKEEPKPKKRGRPKKGETREPIKPTILKQQKDMKSVKEKLSLISTDCGVGVKQNSKGNREVWIGGKLHISVVDGDIPITAFYSGANVQSIYTSSRLASTSKLSSFTNHGSVTFNAIWNNSFVMITLYLDFRSKLYQFLFYPLIVRRNLIILWAFTNNHRLTFGLNSNYLQTPIKQALYTIFIILLHNSGSTYIPISNSNLFHFV